MDNKEIKIGKECNKKSPKKQRTVIKGAEKQHIVLSKGRRSWYMGEWQGCSGALKANMQFQDCSDFLPARDLHIWVCPGK